MGGDLVGRAHESAAPALLGSAGADARAWATCGGREAGEDGDPGSGDVTNLSPWMGVTSYKRPFYEEAMVGFQDKINLYTLQYTVKNRVSNGFPVDRGCSFHETNL